MGTERAGALLGLALLALWSLGSGPLPAQELARDALAREQGTVRERFREAEKRLLEMAQSLKESDPARAERLTEVVALARQKFIADAMSRIEQLLKQKRYTEAIQVEQQVLENLSEIVDILSAQHLSEDVEGLRGLARKLDDLIERQRRAAEALSAAQLAQALKEQEGIYRDAAQLQGELSALQDLAGSISGQMRSASRAMEAAIRELAAGEARAAAPHQGEALAALQEARRAAQQRLARLVAEKQRETLRRLLAIFLDVLGRQRAISEDTARLDARLPGKQPPSREQQLEARGLAERERQLMPLLGQASALLEADESGQAVAALLHSLGEDLEAVAGRLDRVQAGRATQELQRMVEETLQEAIAALQAEQQWRASNPQEAEREAARSPEGKGPLLPALTQLKLMRTVQAGLNRHTELLEAGRTAQGTLSAEVAGELKRLAHRQAELKAMAEKLQASLTGAQEP